MTAWSRRLGWKPGCGASTPSGSRSASSCWRSSSMSAPIRRARTSTTTSCGRPMHSSTDGPRSSIRSPSARIGNGYFQDVLPTGPGRAQIPFPPLPAIILLPFVAVFGLGTNGAAVAAVLGARQRGAVLADAAGRHAAAVGGAAGHACSTASAPWPGMPRCWAPPGSWRTSSPSRSCSSPSPWPCGPTPAAHRRGRVAGHSVRAVRRRPAASAWPALARLTTILGAPFFVFVGGGGTLAATSAQRRHRRAHPGAAAAGLQRGHHRQRLPPGVRAPLPGRVPAHGRTW